MNILFSLHSAIEFYYVDSTDGSLTEITAVSQAKKACTMSYCTCI